MIQITNTSTSPITLHDQHSNPCVLEPNQCLATSMIVFKEGKMFITLDKDTMVCTEEYEQYKLEYKAI